MSPIILAHEGQFVAESNAVGILTLLDGWKRTISPSSTCLMISSVWLPLTPQSAGGARGFRREARVGGRFPEHAGRVLDLEDLGGAIGVH